MKQIGRLKSAKSLYLLSGKIICGECDGKMYGRIRYRTHAEQFPGYVCSSNKAICSNLKEIDKTSLEQYVIELVQEHCNASLIDLEQNSPPFRCELQKHIHSVKVPKKTVCVWLYVREEIR